MKLQAFTRLSLKKRGGSYIGMTKRKIKDCIKEHQNDVNAKFNTALAQLHKKEIIKIDFENVRKIAHYSNQKYALLHEALEISRDAGTWNHIEHAKIYPLRWSLTGEAHDQTTDKKEDMTIGQGSVTDDGEEPLRKISQFFWRDL